MTIRELLRGETALAYLAMRELRPHVGEEDEFSARVDDVQRPQGYRLVGSFESGVDHAAAVAGFRVGDNLAWGHFLYVDDLSTLPAARRRGHGAALLEWLRQEAERLGCDQVHLDSGTQRHDAHRVYLSTGYAITSFHFVRLP